MVMDFGELKTIVNRQIINRLDHAFVMRCGENNAKRVAFMQREYGNVVEVEYQPTCETMLVDFAQRIDSALPESVKLISLKLHETATSYAEWFSDDNR